MMGGKGAPSWVTTLVLAERWGVTPMELERQRGVLKWAARLAALDEAREWKRSFDKD